MFENDRPLREADEQTSRAVDDPITLLSESPPVVQDAPMEALPAGTVRRDGSIEFSSSEDTAWAVKQAMLDEWNDVLDLAAVKIPDEPRADGKSPRAEFLKNVNDFVTRNQTDAWLSPNDVTRTLAQVEKLLTEPFAVVTDQQRIDLAQQIMFHAAHPNRIDQGMHPTCALSDIEILAFTWRPDIAAAVIVQVALYAQFETADKMIKIPPPNFFPDYEATINPPRDGYRTFASQLFQSAIANSLGQHLPEPKYYSVITPEWGGLRPWEYKDYWTNSDGFPLRRELLTHDGTPWMSERTGKPITVADDFLGLTIEEIETEAERLLGGEEYVFKYDTKKLEPDTLPRWNTFASEAEFRELIASMDRGERFPLIASVASGSAIFAPEGFPDFLYTFLLGHRQNHVVVVSNYNPDTDEVFVDNTWGSDGDRWVKLSDFYSATVPR